MTLPSGGTPPGPPGPPPGGGPVVPPVTIGHTYAPQWRNLGVLTTALTVLFWSAAGAAVLLLVAVVNQRVLVEDVLSGEFVTFDEATTADNFVVAAWLLCLALSVALGVLVIVFLWRASKNLQAWGRTGARLGPGWSIGSWFIPFANLVMPVLIIQDLWRGSDPAAGRDEWRGRVSGSVLVGFWWASWIVMWLLGNATGNTSETDTFNQTADALRLESTTSMAFAVAFGTAAVLAANVFRTLGRRFDVLRGLPPIPAVPPRSSTPPPTASPPPPAP